MLNIYQFPLNSGELYYSCYQAVDTGNSELTSAIREIVGAKDFATRILHRIPNLFLLFSSPSSSLGQGQILVPSLPSFKSQPALLCHLIPSCIIMINKIMFPVRKRGVTSIIILGGVQPYQVSTELSFVRVLKIAFVVIHHLCLLYHNRRQISSSSRKQEE